MYIHVYTWPICDVGLWTYAPMLATLVSVIIVKYQTHYRKLKGKNRKNQIPNPNQNKNKKIKTKPQTRPLEYCDMRYSLYENKCERRMSVCAKNAGSLGLNSDLEIEPNKKNSNHDHHSTSVIECLLNSHLLTARLLDFCSMRYWHATHAKQYNKHTRSAPLMTFTLSFILLPQIKWWRNVFSFNETQQVETLKNIRFVIIKSNK